MRIGTSGSPVVVTAGGPSPTHPSQPHGTPICGSEPEPGLVGVGSPVVVEGDVGSTWSGRVFGARLADGTISFCFTGAGGVVCLWPPFGVPRAGGTDTGR